MGPDQTRQTQVKIQEKRSGKIVGVAALILVSVFALSSSLFSGSSNSKSSGANKDLDVRARGLVNKNLQADEALKTLRENEVVSEHRSLQEKGLKFDSESLHERRAEMIDATIHDGSDTVYEEIYGENRVYDNHLNPEDRVEGKLRKTKLLEEYDYQQKLAFIEAFVENAYEQGYEVRLNEDLEVISVKQINPTGPYRGSASLVKLLEKAD